MPDRIEQPHDFVLAIDKLATHIIDFGDYKSICGSTKKKMSLNLATKNVHQVLISIKVANGKEEDLNPGVGTRI